MDLPGASYFYTLAQIGITFSGFAALLMALRQMRGSDLTKFQLWVTRAYVQSGLVTAMNAMLSPLLYGLGLSLEMTWQVASVWHLDQLPGRGVEHVAWHTILEEWLDAYRGGATTRRCRPTNDARRAPIGH